MAGTTLLGASIVTAALLVAGPVQAQTGSIRLLGSLVGRDRRPVVGALVYFDTSTTAERTDSAGDFRLPVGRLGEHVLHLRALGFTPRNLRFSLSETDSQLVELGVIDLAPGPPPTLRVVGVVADSLKQEPIVAAAVGLNSMVRALTDTRGAFVIDGAEVDWGENRIEIRHVGYEPLQAPVWVDLPAASIEVSVGLKPVPVTLSEVVVEGDRTVIAFGHLAEFYRRKRSGFGRFITAADIENRHPVYLTDLMRGMAGAGLVTDSLGKQRIVSQRAAGRCLMAMYVDGVPV
jgi:hypothetical protein